MKKILENQGEFDEFEEAMYINGIKVEPDEEEDTDKQEG